MKSYRFTLEAKGSRHSCPNCGKRREFTRFIDTHTGEPLPEQYGKCNRVDRCGYFLSPYHDGYARSIWDAEKGTRSDGWKFQPKPKIRPKPKPPASFMDKAVLLGSLTNYDGNHFVNYLVGLMGEEITDKLVKRYHIGSTGHRFKNKDFPDYISEAGANIFWYIDIYGRIIGGKVMLYDPLAGKRIKNPFNHVTWMHKIVGPKGFELQKRLFGEDLLKDNSHRTVAIVESEKTAIIASVYLPNLLWLACGSKDYLTVERCQSLRGRKVVLYPDLNAFDIWSKKAVELAQQLPGTTFTVSDLLERKATDSERSAGLDLADYLVQHNWRDFIGGGVEIQIEDIDCIVAETVINGFILACLRTITGMYYDVLYNASGEVIPPNDADTNCLPMGYNRNYQPGIIDGVPCLVSQAKGK